MPDAGVFKGLGGSSYYNQRWFNNEKKYLLDCELSTTLALFDYFESFIFPRDPSRLVYATNSFAFRARQRTLRGNENSEFQANSLSLPFMNLGIKQGGISFADTNLFSSFQAKTQGILLDGIEVYARLIPVTIQYEGTFFTDQTADAHVVLQRAFRRAVVEQTLKPSLYYGENEIINVLKLNFTDIVLDDMYQESDWLERNRIHTVGFDISADTYMVDIYPGAETPYDGGEGSGTSDDEFSDTGSRGWKVNQLYLTYASRFDLDEWKRTPCDYDGLLSAVVDHINEKVWWNKLVPPIIEALEGQLSPPIIEEYKEDRTCL